MVRGTMFYLFYIQTTHQMYLNGGHILNIGRVLIFKPATSSSVNHCTVGNLLFGEAFDSQNAF